MTSKDLLEKKNDVYHLDGAASKEITAIEETLGLKFAYDYKSYLSTYGLLSYDGHELTGICKSSRLNVLDSTKREKAENDAIMSNMYLLEYVGVENITVWQDSDGLVYEAEYKKPPVKICDSLCEYIEKF